MMMMMMMMQSGDLTKQRMMKAKALSYQTRGGLNLGKKMSVPRDVMMEELNLTSNRGSRMYQERHKRSEKFTVENVNNNVYINNVPHIILESQEGQENQAYPVPGDSVPLKEEKFKTTLINPKSYSSPWIQALGNNEEHLLHLHQLPQTLQLPDYRCFNRSAAPYGGSMVSRRVVPVISFEAVESHKLPGLVLERMVHRPNFNRAPRGWGQDYKPESNEL